MDGNWSTQSSPQRVCVGALGPLASSLLLLRVSVTLLSRAAVWSEKKAVRKLLKRQESVAEWTP